MTLLPNSIVKGGDAESLHYPVAYYLKESLSRGIFPFWTEKIYSGFPIYANSETGYLNPMHIASIVVFGAYNSFKVEHFFWYLSGSLGLYFFLKRHNFHILGILLTQIVFYFSFFHIFRQSMFNMMYVTFSFPLSLYFLEKAFKEKVASYSFLFGILISIQFLYGNVNTVFFNLIPLTLYFFTDFKNSYKFLPKFVFFSMWGFLIISLPLLLSSGQLYMQSARASGGLDFRQGSVAPFVSLTLIYPFLFGVGKNFFGQTLNNNYLIHEIYFYSGISTFVIAFIGFLITKKDQIWKFSYLLILLFLATAFLEYLPISKYLDFAPINIFRYWVRTSIYLNFGLALLTGKFVSDILKGANLKLHFSNIVLLILVPVYLVILEVVNKIPYPTKIFLNHIRSGGFVKDVYFWHWFFLGLLTFLLVIASLSKRLKYLTIFFVIVTVADLFYFGNVINSDKYTLVDSLVDSETNKVTQELSDKRIIYTNPEIVGNKSLYYKPWSLFGYSLSFESSNYGKYLKLVGFDSQRRYQDERVPDDVLSKLGVWGYMDYFKYRSVKQQEIDITFPKLTGDYILKSEGHLKMKVNVPIDGMYRFAVKDYPGWSVFIDNKKVNAKKSFDDVYFRLDLTKGDHLVEFKFIPVIFYIGIFGSILLTLPLLYLLKSKYNARTRL